MTRIDRVLDSLDQLFICLQKQIQIENSCNRKLNMHLLAIGFLIGATSLALDVHLRVHHILLVLIIFRRFKNNIRAQERRFLSEQRISLRQRLNLSNAFSRRAGHVRISELHRVSNIFSDLEIFNRVVFDLIRAHQLVDLIQRFD